MQLTLDHALARAEADAGMARALGHAERETPAWGAAALAYLRRYAETHDEFAGFFVTLTAESDPTFPAVKGQAWGAIWIKAQKLGIVLDTGRSMKHPRRHNCKAIVWRSLIFDGRHSE